MAVQRRLDEYLAHLGKLKQGKPANRNSLAAGTNTIRALALCLKPNPRPRTVLICGSPEDARSELHNSSSDYVELQVERVASMLCKGIYPNADTIVFSLDTSYLSDKWSRLLVFWTIRSIPQKFRVILVIPELVNSINELGGEKVLPLKPPREWSWLITVILGKIGKCWEAFI